MKTKYKISAEEAMKIRERIKSTKNATACRRMEAVALLGEGKTPKEVAEIKQYNEKYIRYLGLLYHQQGLEVLGSDGRKGGNNAILKNESSEFLEQFKKQASEGKIPNVAEISNKLDEKTGKKRKSRSTAYSFLHRNGWRKIMPRSKHPKKASDEEIDSSKKLTTGCKN